MEYLTILIFPSTTSKTFFVEILVTIIINLIKSINFTSIYYHPIAKFMNPDLSNYLLISLYDIYSKNSVALLFNSKYKTYLIIKKFLLLICRKTTFNILYNRTTSTNK